MNTDIDDGSALAAARRAIQEGDFSTLTGLLAQRPALAIAVVPPVAVANECRRQIRQIRQSAQLTLTACKHPIS
jgi:hypothetical protein